MSNHIPGLAATVLLIACSTVSETGRDPDRGSHDRVEPPFAELHFVAVLQPDEAGIVDGGLGGLSGIAWDAERDLLLAISDDPGQHGPVRLYEFALSLSLDGDASTWVATSMIELVDANGPLDRGSTDAEDLALLGDGRLLISSEGTDRAPPFLRVFGRNGEQLEDLSLPGHLIPDSGRGTRPNLGLEAVAALPSATIFAGLENALVQDGPEAGIDVPSPARILRWGATGNREEFVYLTDPVVHAPQAADDFHTNGLVALVALDEDRLLALERSYTVGFDNGVRLFLVDLSQADDVAGLESIGSGARLVDKMLLADLSGLQFNLDNLEGLTWGPALPDGRRTLLMVSDDNFSDDQTTHLLIFAVADRVSAIPEIQGHGHESPVRDRWLFGVEGTVTQIRPGNDDRNTAWLQTEPDHDPLTSDGLRLTYDAASVDLRRGDVVSAWGRLVEAGQPGELTVTTLVASRLTVTGQDAVPEPVRLDPRSGGVGPGERAFLPLPLDDDGMTGFDPAASAIDLLESLEGMRVALPSSTAVSGTSAFGEVALLPDGAAGLRSPAGGVVLTPESFNPQRLIAIGMPQSPAAPIVAVGDRFDDPINGVLDYSFGNFKLVVDVWPGVVRRRNEARLQSPPTVPWQAAEDDLTFATYNVLNLDPSDGDQFDRLAASIVAGLASPDVLAVQEIQDNNGPEDEGVTAADLTLDMLVDAITGAGGPSYRYVQIDPFHNREGGQPVGNIRVAYLYRPDRVELIVRGPGDTATSIESDEYGAFSLSPGRVGVEHPAFAGDELRGWEPGRPCLAAAFTFRDRSWQFVNCHLKSKRGDDRLFGSSQPPVFRTEQQRSSQTEVLAALARRILAASPEASLVVLGDTNEHEFRRPIRILTAAGLTNLIDEVSPNDRYTYNFNGNSQVLDNILVSPAVEACGPQVAIVHWNTDLPDSQQASDHDPVAVRVPDCR